MKKLGKKLIKNGDVSIYAELVCITNSKLEYIGDNLFYFDELPNDPEGKLQIIYNTQHTAPEIQKHIYKNSNEIVAIDDYFFTSDKLISRFGWVFDKYIIKENNEAYKPMHDSLTCNRCNNSFVNSSIGLICFKCGVLSNDLIYKK